MAKRVTVTGGSGFLGRYVVQRFRDRGDEVFVPLHGDFDLTREADVRRLYAEARPEIVVHLAARVGGIGANKAHPAQFFYETVQMGTSLIHWAERVGVSKFVTIGTTCSYPRDTPVPFHEDDLWNGYPNEVTAPYGIAKRMLLAQGQAYRDEYGFNSIHLLPVNLFGPFDNFDLETSHVIPALVRKCLEAAAAGAPEVVCWGDGTATREFLYVDDCAEAIVLATDRYDGPEPVNIGTGVETPIRDLVAVVAEVCGFHGEIVWDASRPNGQQRRSVDTSRAAAYFGFTARTGFREGLTRTVAWYRDSLYNQSR